MGRTEGENQGYKNENPSKIFFFQYPLVEKNTGAGGYAQISDCYVIYLLCYSIAGHSLGALMYPKTWYIRIALTCFKKFKCLIDVLASVSLPGFAKLRSQLLDVFKISSDFDLAQHFSCSGLKKLIVCSR